MRLRFTLSAAALVVAIPPAAQATVTQSSITSPADGTQLSAAFDSGGSAGTFTVTGTAPGAADADEVRIVCVTRNLAGTTSASNVVQNVAIDTDAFTAQVPIDALRDPGCRLRALDQSAPTPADLAPFAGPRVRSQLQFDRFTAESDASGRLRFDYEDRYYFGGPATRLELDSMGGCGLFGTASQDPAGEPQNGLEVWACAAWYDDQDEGSAASRSELRVDGQDAFTAAMIDGGVRALLQGVPPLTVSRTLDPVTGELTVTEASDIVRCESPVFPISGSCGRLLATGVRYERTVRTRAQGRQVEIADRYISADGAQHTLDGLMELDVEGSGDPGLQFPWLGSDFVQYTGDPSLAGPSAAPGSWFVKSDRGTVDTLHPMGAATFVDAPDRIEFFGSSNTATVAKYPQMKYVRAIAAGGAYPQTWTLSWGTSEAEVTALALQAEDRGAPPSVAITAPADGATVPAGPLTVTGTAADNAAVTEVSVNGVAAALSGGTWSAALTLAPGPATLVATAKDAAGNATTASVTITAQAPPVVTPTPTPVAQTCRVPKVIGRTIAQARARLAAAKCALGKVRTKYFKPRVVRRRGKRVKVPYKRGRIVKQAIAAGSVRPVGTKVAVTRQGAKPKRKKRAR